MKNIITPIAFNQTETELVEGILEEKRISGPEKALELLAELEEDLQLTRWQTSRVLALHFT